MKKLIISSAVITFTILGIISNNISAAQSRYSRCPNDNNRGSYCFKLGDRGPLVYQLIEKLRCAGYYKLRNDSYFGPVTQQAVIKFQRDRGLAADGVVGPDTYKLLTCDRHTSETQSREDSNISNRSSTPSGLPMYEDEIIKVRVLGASDRSGVLQASLLLENKTTQDLLLALETGFPTVISDLGESGLCNIAGIKTYVGTSNSNPALYSRLKPNQKLTISITECNHITQSSPAKSFSINMPIVRLIGEEPTQPFTVDISGIPIRTK